MVEKKTIDDWMSRVSDKYKQVTVKFYGSGDCFGDFTETTAVRRDDTAESVMDDREAPDEEMLFQILESAGADFNNDGCEGDIVFDLDAWTLTVNLGWPVTTYDYESKEIEI